MSKAPAKQTNMRRPTTWKPGQSGNPKGRPKKDTCLTDILRGKLSEVPDIQIQGKKNTRAWNELLVDSMLRNAIKGNAPILKEIWERLEGKVTLPVGGEDGEDIQASLVINVVDKITKKLTQDILDGKGTE